MDRPSRWVCVACAVLAVGAAGCGDDKPTGPAGGKPTAPDAGPVAPVGALVARDRPSSDPGIADLQQKLSAWRQTGRLDTAKENWRLSVPMRPTATFDPKKTYLWVLQTDHGTLRVRLWTEKAPKHAANVAYLSLIGFYDGLTLHRVMKGKEIAGGCPVGDGLGTPGYGFEPEYGDEKANAHDRRGLVVSTGIGGATDDSKFRILLGPDAAEKPLSTVFGEVVESDTVLSALEALGTEKGVPAQRVVIQRADLEIR